MTRFFKTRLHSKYRAFVPILVATLAVAPAVAEDPKDSLSEHGVEQVSERLTHDSAGRVVQSVTTRKRAVSMTETVTEVRKRGTDGLLHVVERTTSCTDLTGGNLTKKERLIGNGPGLTVVYTRRTIVNADGTSILTEYRIDKQQSLALTRRLATIGSLADQTTTDERWTLAGVLQSRSERHSKSKTESDGTVITVTLSTSQKRNKSGMMEITGQSQTVRSTRPDGTVVTVVSTRNPDGSMVPTRRTTTTKDQDGSALTIAEKRGADGAWITASESSTVNTHVSGIKIPEVQRTDRIKYGPQK